MNAETLQSCSDTAVRLNTTVIRHHCSFYVQLTRSVCHWQPQLIRKQTSELEILPAVLQWLTDLPCGIQSKSWVTMFRSATQGHTLPIISMKLSVKNTQSECDCAVHMRRCDRVSSKPATNQLPAFYYSCTSRPLKMGPIRRPETSVKDYHSTLRYTPEERRSHQHRGGNLKSKTGTAVYVEDVTSSHRVTLHNVVHLNAYSFS
jgi:hypothetical protein